MRAKDLTPGQKVMWWEYGTGTLVEVIGPACTGWTDVRAHGFKIPVANRCLRPAETYVPDPPPVELWRADCDDVAGYRFWSYAPTSREAVASLATVIRAETDGWEAATDTEVAEYFGINTTPVRMGVYNEANPDVPRG